jgi:hypothetical protein
MNDECPYYLLLILDFEGVVGEIGGFEMKSRAIEGVGDFSDIFEELSKPLI